MNERFQNWRTTSRTAPVFFLFLILGPFVVLPFLIVTPAIVTFRAAWSKQPHFAWRLSAACTITLALLLTLPSSPLFWRLDLPIPPQDPFLGGFSWMLEMQRPYLNAAIISLAIALPLSAASTIATKMTQRGITKR